MLAELLGRLSARQRWVLEERLAGRSLPGLAAEVGSSRQAVHTSERLALAKLGARGSVESIVNSAERAERAERLRERAGVTGPDRRRMVQTDPRGPGRGPARAPDVGEELSDRLWAEIEAAERAGRELPADRWAYYAGAIAAAR